VVAPARRTLALVLALVIVGCGSGGTPGVAYKQGMAAFKGGDMGGAIEGLQTFVDKACGGTKPDRRCRGAFVTLGRAREKHGEHGGAWAAFDAALAFPPHGKDAEVEADRERNQRALVDGNAGSADRSPVILRYRDEVSEEYTPRSVVISLDFDSVLTKDKDASELHGGEFRKVYGGSVPAGEHLLVVEAVHDCKPSGGAPCERSHLRKAWGFRSAPHTPTTVEIRTYAEPGAGDGPARPAIEFTTR
jgi:hypothetical protein